MRTLIWVGALLGLCAGCVAPVAAQTPADDQMTCQYVAGQAEIDGAMQPISGLACRQPDGTWQVQQADDVAAYPIQAYPYYDAWYWGPPVVIGFGASFVFADRFHHGHPMHHVHWGRPAGGMNGRGGFHGAGGMHGWDGSHAWGGMGGGHRR